MAWAVPAFDPRTDTLRSETVSREDTRCPQDEIEHAPSHSDCASNQVQSFCRIRFLRHTLMSRSTFHRAVPLAVGLMIASSSVAMAQQPKPGTAATAPAVGDMAPDFSLPGASRYGLLKEPVKLSAFRGQTVVIAFFPKARTKG